MLCYCKKCGRIVDCDEHDEECDYCRSIVYPVPDEYLGGISKMFIKDDLKEQFINDYIKSSPEFDQYLFEHRDEYLFQKSMEMRSLLDTSNKVTCPYCHSVNVRKLPKKSLFISNSLLFGGNLSEVGKNFHCNSCGADF